MELVSVDGHGHQLDEPAAEAFLHMAAAAGEAGLGVSISTAYRSHEQQTQLYAAYEAAKARGENPTPVAKPGTSNHEKGTAVDIHVASNPRLLAWLREHGPSYGFHETVAREPWHFDFIPERTAQKKASGQS
jgi:D-alanyl-D-alanine carboxypeptidase